MGVNIHQIKVISLLNLVVIRQFLFTLRNEDEVIPTPCALVLSYDA